MKEESITLCYFAWQRCIIKDVGIESKCALVLRTVVRVSFSIEEDLFCSGSFGGAMLARSETFTSVKALTAENSECLGCESTLLSNSVPISSCSD